MITLYCVVYRTGGTKNFKWNRSIALPTKKDAESLKKEVERKGYKAIVEQYERSVSIGLPEGYEYKGK